MGSGEPVFGSDAYVAAQLKLAYTHLTAALGDLYEVKRAIGAWPSHTVVDALIDGAEVLVNAVYGLGQRIIEHGHLHTTMTEQKGGGDGQR